MLFKVLAGRHTAAKVVYSAGDIVESDRDLVALFGDNKFQRDLEAEAKQKASVSKPPAEEAPKKTSSKKTTTKKPKDVTDKFKSAVDNDLLITKIGKKYFVAEKANPDDILHEDSLKQDEVEEFINELYEAE